MKTLFRCDYCSVTGTEDEVRAHEPTCMNNYDRESCYTCAHRQGIKIVNHLCKYECDEGIDIPEGKLYEHCKSYIRKDNAWTSDFIKSMLGGFNF